MWAAGASAACRVPGHSRPLESLWRPDMRAAIAYAERRAGDISFAVRTPHSFDGYRADEVDPSASLLKAMLLVAYLDRPQIRAAPLRAFDLSLLAPMITRSDNDAAGTVLGIVGASAVYAVAAAAHMTAFALESPWGLSHVTARDETKLFLHIDDLVAPAHRWYAMHLLASITASQRWGIGEIAPRGWRLYFKGGWGSGTGRIDHQTALLTRGCARLSVSVLTLGDGTHAYGEETLRGIFARLLRRLPA
jgi:hypothetical protein